MSEHAPRPTIPPERKALYYGGLALMVIGVVMFVSVFFSASQSFGDFDGFKERARNEMSRSLLGMGLVVVGGILVRIGARGLAGAGVLLDPEQARKDVEPWSRMAGGVAHDALSEVGVARTLEKRLDAPPTQVKVRCRGCQALNEETARFCGQCGAAL